MADKSKGFIKLYRSMTEWEWFKDSNTVHLFIYCLLKANHKDISVRGIKIKRGSFLTTYKEISEETGLSIQQIRTSIKKLKSTHELTQQKTLKCSIISILNYDRYQAINTISNTLATP